MPETRCTTVDAGELSPLRKRYHSMNLDAQTFARLRRLAESRGVSLVDVVRSGIALVEAGEGVTTTPRSRRSGGGGA